MKRLLLALILLVMAAGPCEAQQATVINTYYVRAGGSDSNPGTSNTDGGAWRTMAYANSVLRPGDVLHVHSINPSDTLLPTNTIAPTLNGSASAPIVYIGRPEMPADSMPTIVSMTSNYRWVTVRGFRIRQYARFGTVTPGSVYAQDNRMANCVVGRLEFRGAKKCVVESCYVTSYGAGPTISMWGRYDDRQDIVYNGVIWSTADCYVNHCYIDLGSINTVSRVGYGILLRFWATRNHFMWNTITGLFTGTYSDFRVAAMGIIHSGTTDVRGNRWELDADRPPDTTGVSSDSRAPIWSQLYLADSARSNTFNCDTLYGGFSNGYKVGVRMDDGVTDPSVPHCLTNSWDSCRFVCKGPLVFLANGDMCDFTYNQVRTKDYGLGIPGGGLGLEVKFNTIMSSSGAALVVRPPPYRRTTSIAPEAWHNILVTEAQRSCTADSLGSSVLNQHPTRGDDGWWESFITHDSDLMFTHSLADTADHTGRPYASYRGQGQSCWSLEQSDSLDLHQIGLNVYSHPTQQCAYGNPALYDTSFSRNFDTRVSLQSGAWRPGYWLHGDYVGCTYPSDTVPPDSCVIYAFERPNQWVPGDDCGGHDGIPEVGGYFSYAVTFAAPSDCDSIEFAIRPLATPGDTDVAAITDANFDTYKVGYTGFNFESSVYGGTWDYATKVRDPGSITMLVFPKHGCGDDVTTCARVALRAKRNGIYSKVSQALWLYP